MIQQKPVPSPPRAFPANPHAPMLLNLQTTPTPPAGCATEHTESELPIMPLGRLLKLTIPSTMGIVAILILSLIFVYGTFLFLVNLAVHLFYLF